MSKVFESPRDKINEWIKSHPNCSVDFGEYGTSVHLKDLDLSLIHPELFHLPIEYMEI